MTVTIFEFVDQVIEHFSEVDDLLPLRRVSRQFKQVADRRICQLVLFAVSGNMNPGDGGMGVFEVTLSGEDLKASDKLLTVMDGESMFDDDNATYHNWYAGVGDGDLEDHLSDSSDGADPAVFLFVASEVVFADETWKVRCSPVDACSFRSGREDKVEFCAIAPGGKVQTTVLDEIQIDTSPPETKDSETLNENRTRIYYNLETVGPPDDERGTESSPTTGLQSKDHLNFTFQLQHLDVPMTVLLKAIPGWRVVEDDERNYDFYEDRYYDYDENGEDYDIDDDSDYWRRQSD